MSGWNIYDSRSNADAVAIYTADPMPNTCISVVPTYIDQLTNIMTQLSTSKNKIVTVARLENIAKQVAISLGPPK